MRSLSALVAASLAAVAFAAPARAEQGTGLYAPFPSPSGGARAERFVGELGVRAKERQLVQGEGVGAGGTVSARPAAASARAGVGLHLASGLAIGLIAGVAVALALGIAILRDRPEDIVTSTTN